MGTPAVEHAGGEAYTTVARTMQEAAAEETGPAAWPAQVIAHHRISWDLAIVRVQADSPVPYRAGQHVSVQTPQRPRLWRYLSPANAPREDGMLEFHIRGVENGWVSRAIVNHTQVGDTWLLGPALGTLTAERTHGRDVLMVAGGTGLAPMRAIVDEFAQYGENPAVHLFYGGRSTEDLYDLDPLRDLAAVNPWLTVTPVLERGSVHGAETGTLASAVTRYGAWQNHSVLVSGSPAMIRGTVSRMLVAGTTLDQISYDPFAIDMP
jgi:NAD(P)H-flavin reductase